MYHAMGTGGSRARVELPDYVMEGIVKPELAASPFLLGICLLFLSGCSSTDDARVLQVLNERGFGRKYSGNANETFYFGVGDSFTYSDSFNKELKGNGKIAMDGTVFFEELGETYVAGLTSKEIASMLDQRYSHYYKFVDVTVKPKTTKSKKIFIYVSTDRHAKKTFTGDMTLYDIITSVKYDSIVVDMRNIKVVRADPVNPMVIYCNMHDMIHNGNSRDNILLKENDIIYMTPSIVGHLKNFVNMLVTPLKPIAQLFTQVNKIDRMMDTFSGDEYYNNNRGYY
jgi:protein involved in polysaccharide export with SLBB domain